MRRIISALIALLCLSTIFVAQEQKMQSNHVGPQGTKTIPAQNGGLQPQDVCILQNLYYTTNLPSSGGTWTATWTYYQTGIGCGGSQILQTNVGWIQPNSGTITCNQTNGNYTCSESYTVAANSGGTRSGQIYVNFGSAGQLTGTVTQFGPLESLTVNIVGSGRVTGNGINCPGTCTNSYSYGTGISLTATPSSGWVFTGWTGACSGTGACNLTMYGNYSVTATFTALETLTVSVSGTGSVRSTDGYINCPGTCSHSYLQNTLVSLNAYPGTGWIFSGWSGACSGNGSCNLTMSQNLSVSATFLQNHTLTVTTSGSGSVNSTDGYINCPGTCSHIYPSGTPVTLIANPAQGWSLTAWGGACSGNAPTCTVNMTQDRAVSATFNPNHTLIVTTSGNGSVYSSDGYISCPGVCSHTYPYGAPVTLNSNPAQGWSLNAWGGACSGNGPTCTLTMTQDQSVSATFTQNHYTLTVSIAGSGTVTSSDGYINCPGTCTHTYLSLTLVTLTATPAQGWIFSGWVGACAGTGSCLSTILQNESVTAVFVQPGHGAQFTPVTPCRLVDTRHTGNPIQGNSFQNYDIPLLGNCGVPTGASAYSLNITVLPHGALGYITVWPAGEAQPGTSTLSSNDGRTKADAVIVPAGTSDSISVFATNTTDVLLDIDGYFTAPSSQTYQFYPLTPCRVVDTRGANGPLGGPYLSGLQARDLPITTSSCIPGGVNAKAYSLNFTVVPHPQGQALGYLTVWPTGTSQPVTSTLNNPTATTVANAAIVAAGTGGDIEVFPDQNTDLIVDINGYFAAPGTGGLSMYGGATCRVLDTRQNQGQPFQGEKTVNVTGSVCAPPSNALAYIFNATVIPPGSFGYLTLWTDGKPQPAVSTLNASDGLITSNMAIVSTTNGSIDAYASSLTQLILDITGYFAP